MKLKIFFSIVAFLPFVFACNKFPSGYIEIKDFEQFDDQSFKDTQYLYSSIVDDEFIGNPSRITKADSILYAVDASTDSIVHIFNIDKKTYHGMVIGRGAGPNELLSVNNITLSVDNKSIWVYDIMGRKWVQFDREQLYQTNKSIVTDKILFSKNQLNSSYLNEPEWISDSLFICLDVNSYKNRFLIFDKELKNVLSVQNQQFSFNEDYPLFILNDMFSTKMGMKPDKTKIVLAGSYLDCIEIYNIDGTLTKLLKGPEKGFHFQYNKEQSLNRGALIKSRESKRAYIGLKTTNKGIYALYSGKEKQDPSHYSNSNIIYAFDWDGNPLKKYILDCQIGAFDIDETGDKIFAIKEPDNYIVSFDL
jgi:hypothetical protein